ncbi:helix-turn-helix domain-containing protein [Streptomyces clavuligerus]|nr:helix-turn-helix domain-containing protein [Streptomyces clavuligerus]
MGAAGAEPPRAAGLRAGPAGTLPAPGRGGVASGRAGAWNGAGGRRRLERHPGPARPDPGRRPRRGLRLESRTAVVPVHRPDRPHPERAAMLVRLDRAARALSAGRNAADTALSCGYTDQSPLHRDVLAFAGRTPGALAATANAADRPRGTGPVRRPGPGPRGPRTTPPPPRRKPL